MSSLIHSLTSGLSGFVFVYIVALIPTVIGLRHGKASTRCLLTSPLLALFFMFVAGVVDWLVTDLVLLRRGIAFESVTSVLCQVLISVAVGYLGGRRTAAKEHAQRDSHRRGAVVSNSEPTSWLQQLFGGIPSPRPEIILAGLPIAPLDETKHFKLIGTTGTGKSTAIREILSPALARGDRMVIADPDGGYLRNFYNRERGDVILNPFEPDSAKWSLLGEITRDYDVDQLARSLIPTGMDDARIWNGYARTFFTAVVQRTMLSRFKDDTEIDRLVSAAPVDELKLLLKGTPAGPFLEEGSKTMFGCLRSVTSSALEALKYTTRQRGTPFSVRQWVRHGASRTAGGQGGVLFIPYKAGEIAALSSIISAWMRLAIFEALDKEEGDQRLWFIIDELDALGEIDGLKDALTRLRKVGGRCALGFQSIAQVSGTYGRTAADTMVENCGNTFILRCSASEHGGTSEFASKLIGQREIVQTTQSRTRQPGHWRSSITSSQQVRIEPAVMASEIERLPDLTGFLKLASNPDWHQVKLTPVDYPIAVRARAASSTPDVLPLPVSAGPTTPPSAPDLPTPSASPSAKAPATTPPKSTNPSRKRKIKPTVLKHNYDTSKSNVQPEDGTPAAN